MTDSQQAGKPVSGPRPAIAPPRPWNFPTPRHDELDNGLEVISYRLPGQYVAAASLVLDLPLAAEPAPLEGVAAITSRTLDEGTTEHSADEYAELLESAGAGFGVDVSSAGLQLILDVPVRRLDRALALLAEAVVSPALAPADVGRQVQLRLAEIEQARANPSQAVAVAFRRAVFLAGSRYSRMTDGEPGTVAAITADAARAFHRDHFGPRGAKLIISGEVEDGVAGLAAEHFGSWRPARQQQVEHQPPAAGDQQAVIVHRPGAVQADLQLGGFGIDRTDPRWADITVAAYIMGGAFLSRLNSVLREQLGYTYGVRMTFHPLRAGGTFSVSGSFRTEVIGDALQQVRRLLRIEDRPFTAEEVVDAVTYFTGVAPLRYATAAGVTDQAAVQALALLPEDYPDRRLTALGRVTAESAAAAYTSLVDPDRLTLAIAGDADKIAGPVAEAGFTDVQVTGLD